MRNNINETNEIKAQLKLIDQFLSSLQRKQSPTYIILLQISKHQNIIIIITSYYHTYNRGVSQLGLEKKVNGRLFKEEYSYYKDEENYNYFQLLQHNIINHILRYLLLHYRSRLMLIFRMCYSSIITPSQFNLNHYVVDSSVLSRQYYISIKIIIFI